MEDLATRLKPATMKTNVILSKLSYFHVSVNGKYVILMNCASDVGRMNCWITGMIKGGLFRHILKNHKQSAVDYHELCHDIL